MAQGAKVRPIPAEFVETGSDAESDSFLVVCSSASLGVQLAAVLAGAPARTYSAPSSDSGFEGRSVLCLLAVGRGGAVGYPMPKQRQQSLCATGVQRLVGRALDC